MTSPAEALVRKVIELHNRSGGEELIAAYDELFDPDYELIPAVVGGLEGASYRGREGQRRYYADRDVAFKEGRVEVVRYVVPAEDLVVALARSTGMGRASGAVADEEVGLVYRLRNGKLLRGRVYSSHAEALAAAEAEVAAGA